MSGFAPRLVSWNMTRRCNLRCAHCYLDAGGRDRGQGELTTAEGYRFIDQLADLCPGAMLVLSGGEPLLRTDLVEMVAHASRRELLPVLGTNGLLLTEATICDLVQSGLAGVGISIDSLDAGRHDRFRGLPGAWQKAMAAIETCRRHGLAVQIHTTATKSNYSEIGSLLAFAAAGGAAAFNLFFLVCTGRGEEMTDITPAQYEAALASLVAAQDEYRGRMMIRARCAPHFRRLAHSQSAHMAAAAAGCMAGTSYIRVTPQGGVTPCPYMSLPAGDLRTESLARIWESAPLLDLLRHPALEGRCGRCEFGDLCGGCRARAWATSGDLMAEDPWCDYQPTGVGPADPAPAILWTDAARVRLQRVPVAMRTMVKKGVTAHARAAGLTLITPEVMAQLRPPPAAALRRGRRPPSVASDPPADCPE